MQKKLGAILLIAGTCIGSGMIALPMVLAQLGLLPSIALMLFIWFIMYYTSLVNLELNLQAGEGLSLGLLGRRFSGKGAELFGNFSLKIFSYALLAVFIYGGSSIIKELLESNKRESYLFNDVALYYTIIMTSTLLLPFKIIDYINRFLFMGLLAVITVFITGLLFAIDFSDLPLFASGAKQLSTWAAIVPVVFTSFGFQVIFHTLTNYCNKDSKMLKKAFFWGSLIPAIVYMLWTSSVLSVVYHDNPLFYAQMSSKKIEVGELIQALSTISKWGFVQLLVWWISILAITTSVLGVGVGLCDTMKGLIKEKVPNKIARKISAVLLTILPAYLVVIYVPNAFIAALGFAGMILTIIAVLLPVYLFLQIKGKKLHYRELDNKGLLALSVATALLIMGAELFNMFNA